MAPVEEDMELLFEINTAADDDGNDELFLMVE